MYSCLPSSNSYPHRKLISKLVHNFSTFKSMFTTSCQIAYDSKNFSQSRPITLQLACTNKGTTVTSVIAE